jgi:heme exporter protein D
VNFSSWHDFLYMGGHYLYVWLSYGIGVCGIIVTLARPLLARRRFFAQQRQLVRRELSREAEIDASRTP